MPDTLRPEETDLVGNWLTSNGQVTADQTTLRIEWLVKDCLQPLARDASGWDTLLRDPADGRLWEHCYPQSAMHGGGPPRLTTINIESARQKYGARAV